METFPWLAGNAARWQAAAVAVTLAQTTAWVVATGLTNERGGTTPQ